MLLSSFTGNYRVCGVSSPINRHRCILRIKLITTLQLLTSLRGRAFSIITISETRWGGVGGGGEGDTSRGRCKTKLTLLIQYQIKWSATVIHNIVCGRCSVKELIYIQIGLFFIISNNFLHLKMGTALTNLSLNDLKIEQTIQEHKVV